MWCDLSRAAPQFTKDTSSKPFEVTEGERVHVRVNFVSKKSIALRLLDLVVVICKDIRRSEDDLILGIPDVQNRNLASLFSFVATTNDFSDDLRPQNIN